MKVVRRLAVALFLFSMLVVGLGCPDTDPLEPGNADLTLAIRGVNASATRYERVLFGISQIRFRPEDPTADAALGPIPLGAIDFPIQADLAQGRQEFSTTIFAPGRYRLLEMVVLGVTLIDEDPVLPPATCVEGVVNPGGDGTFGTADDTSTIADPRFGVRIGSNYAFSFSGADTFEVTSGGGTLEVTVDVAALAAAYESSFSCRASTNNICIAQNATPSINCLTAFFQPTFVNAAGPAFSFN